MDFGIPDSLTKIIDIEEGTDPPETDLILADFGDEDGRRFYLVGDGLSESDIDELGLYPTDLADLLKTAIEVVQAPRPEDAGDWAGVSLMVVTSDAIASDVSGWVCKKCHFLVGGAAPSPPDECPGCQMEEEPT